MLDKNAILSANDLTTETVGVPEWGGDVDLRALSGLDMEAFQSSIRDADGKVIGQVRERFLAYSIVDGIGERVFTDADIDALAKKNPLVLNRLFEVAQRINGIGAAAQADIAKN